MTAVTGLGEPGSPEWDLRDIDSPEELAAVEALQLLIWSGGDADVVPGHVLLTAAHNGGLVAGAFVEDRLAGFVWGFLGMDTGAGRPRLKHCSHQLGVHPDYRNTGLGFALKCFQRERVLSQGLDRITWTYDPLLARNARLNIGKLGAVCRTYLRDLYGEMHDALNAGLPSDRFQVDWWIRSEPVAARLGGIAAASSGLTARLARGAVPLNPPSPPNPLPPPEFDLRRVQAGSSVLVEIPPDLPALKAADPALALRWRLATRQVFETLFRRGFSVTEFVTQPGPLARAAYILTDDRGA